MCDNSYTMNGKVYYNFEMMSRSQLESKVEDLQSDIEELTAQVNEITAQAEGLTAELKEAIKMAFLRGYSEGYMDRYEGKTRDLLDAWQDVYKDWIRDRRGEE